MPRSIDVAPRTWCRVAGVRMKKRRPPFPIRVGLVAGWVAACASTTAGTDGRAPDIVPQDAGDVVGDGVADAPPLWPQPNPAAPRLIAPLSCTWHSSRRPTLRWERPAGVESVVVEVCADRPCQRVEQTLEASGDTVRVPEELRPGVHFWRAFALRDGQRGPASFTWEFRAPFRSAPSDTATTTYVDVNGDGYGDAVFHAGRGAYVYFGGPRGFGGSPAQFFPLVGGDELEFADLGDMNGDGFSDVGMSHEERLGIDVPLTLRIYLGSDIGLQRTDRFADRVPEDIDASNFFATSLGDVDGDGYAEISSAGESLARAQAGQPLRSWIHFGSRGGYQRERTVEFRWPAPQPRFFGKVQAVGDFDGDGRVDLVALGWESPERYVSTHYIVPWDEAASNSARSWALQAPPGYDTGGVSENMHRGYCDLNGDGRVEVLAPIYRTDSLAGFPLGQIGVFEHRFGDTAILNTSVIRLSERGGGGITLSCVPDLNGDGYTDVVGSHVEPDNQSVNWFILGNPSGRYQAVRYDNGDRGWAAGTAQLGNDANGDGGSECLFAYASAPARLFSYSRDRGILALVQTVRDPTLSDSDAGFKPIFGSPFLF